MQRVRVTKDQNSNPRLCCTFNLLALPFPFSDLILCSFIPLLSSFLNFKNDRNENEERTKTILDDSRVRFTRVFAMIKRVDMNMHVYVYNVRHLVLDILDYFL